MILHVIKTGKQLTLLKSMIPLILTKSGNLLASIT